MRIAIFGGTFNPIHKGHIFLATQAKKTLKLNKVVFVPAYIPPHKSSQGIMDADERFHMIELAISGKPSFTVSHYEINKKKKVYSVETAEHFKKVFPKSTQLFFLTGADSLKGLDKWKDADKLFGLCEFVVFSRPGFGLGTKEPCIRAIEMAALDISSTHVRECIKKDRSIIGLVPKPVADYIRRKRLYR